MIRFLTFLTFLTALVCFALGQPSAWAITTIPRDFDQLIGRAETVFKGTVTTLQSRWVGEGETRHIATFVTFQVEETYKGQASSEQTLEFLGGAVGDQAMAVPDMPKFEVGQKAVLFVVNNGQQFCPLVGAMQGRFYVVKDVATGHERVFTNEGLPVVNTAEIGQVDEAGVPRLRTAAKTDAQAMTAEAFRAEILSKVATAGH